MSIPIPTTDLLSELLFLHTEIGNTIDPEHHKRLVREFMVKFQLLHTSLVEGDTFPRQWITQENRYDLKPHEINAPISKAAKYEIINADEVE